MAYDRVKMAVKVMFPFALAFTQLEDGISDLFTDIPALHDVMVKRSEDCPESPPDAEKDCIECLGLPTFEYTDPVSGFTCMCEVCRRTQIMITPCTCSGNGEVDIDTVCDFTIKGEGYMPYPNWCTVWYNCSKCMGDLVPSQVCTHDKDVECSCPQDSFQIGETSCKQKPLCEKDFGLEIVAPLDSEYTSYECVPCKTGYHQPKNNSRENCKLIGENTTPSKDITDEQDTPVELSTQLATTSDVPVKTTNIPEGKTTKEPTSTTEEFIEVTSACIPPENATRHDIELVCFPRTELILICIATVILVYIFGLCTYPIIDWIKGQGRQQRYQDQHQLIHVIDEDDKGQEDDNGNKLKETTV